MSRRDLAPGRDNHTRRTRFEVIRGLFALGVLARRFDNDVNAQFAPWQSFCIGLGEHLNAALAHDHHLLVNVHGLREPTVYGVSCEQPSERRGAPRSLIATISSSG